MPHLSEYWLKQEVVRKRGHAPIPVEIKCIDADSAAEAYWDHVHVLIVYLNAVYVDGQSRGRYKGLYLTQADVDALIASLIPKISHEAAAATFAALAGRLSDSAILDQLATARNSKKAKGSVRSKRNVPSIRA